MEKFVNFLASRPSIFAFLRIILENNFKGQKNVFREEFAVKNGEKVLDIGCGTGDFSVLFSPEAYTGIDIDKGYIDYARKKYGKNFLAADATTLPFTDNSYDKVFIVGVLHHLDDEACGRVLTEAKRVLKPEGTVLVMEDLDKKESGFLTKFLHRLDKGKYIRTAEDYKNMLQNYFAVEKDFGIQSGLFPYQAFVLKNPRGNRF